MQTAIFSSKVQHFIRSYVGDITSLALKGSPFPEISIQELLQQIGGYRKTSKKLPKWHLTEGVYYPQKLNIEQTSSEITAAYKASLVQGDSLADLTGGFGVDSYYFSEEFNHVDYFEWNKDLCAIAQHNANRFGKKNIQHYATHGIEAIENKMYDVIYLDPARRHESKGKVFFLKDCEPNVIEHLDYLLTRCKTLLIKTSPMLDISVGLSELTNVNSIYVVAVENEVKELLWLIQSEPPKSLEITTVNLKKKKKEVFTFDFGRKVTPSYGHPKQYLYEPNAAILKSGAFTEISEAFRIEKLHRHSHLYTSEEKINFPGRIFTIERVIPYQKKEMRLLVGIKANITTRNFPESVPQLRKKWKITEGGTQYLFFTTNSEDEKIVLSCSKLEARI